MYRGTTPTITLKCRCGFNLEDADDIWVTIKSAPSTSLYSSMKEDEGVTIKGDRIIASDDYLFISLTQEETLKLKTGKNIIQLRVMIDGDVIASNISNFKIENILKEGVMSK